MADNLSTFMCRMCPNLGVSSSWNLEGLSRPAQGLLLFDQTILQIQIIENAFSLLYNDRLVPTITARWLSYREI